MAPKADIEPILELTIGGLARDAGCSVQSVRWYEAQGLLPAAARTAGNQRRYTADHASRLKFLRHSRDLGFSLDDIRGLLSLTGQPDMACEEADKIASLHLADVEMKIEALEHLRTELRGMVHECRGGRIKDCRVIEVLSDHRECQHKDHLAKKTKALI